ncbi:molybdopterin-dependent oxidoreductase [Methylophaga sp.]|uniref:molybdopterin-dependent oxidoreductase n=1 Tax=Methylophaga sp. TaxID=2024840 RepID=UPI003F696DCC
MGKEHTIQTTCPYCGVGCGVLATPQTDGTVTVEGDPNHPANLGRLCSKGSALGETVDLGNRLLHPKIDGKRVTWDNALDTVSRKFKDIIARHGPNSVGFYVSGQVLTEDYYTANKLMKGFIGSANIDTNSRLCMSSAVAGYKRAFGSDSVPCSYEDLELADLIVITGSNLAWCHPVLFQRIVKAKQDRPEMKVVVIDPRKTATCELADLHLPLRPGSDATLFNGLLNYLKKEDYLDLDFLEQHAEGFSAALKAAKESAGNIPQVSAVTELPEEDIIKFYQLFASTERAITLYSQGVNQSTSGTDKSNSILNCHIATGRVGKPAMGPFSITGQPNAMGGREVGGLSNQLAAHMEITNPEHHDRVSRFWETEQLATENGAKAVDLFNDIYDGKIKAVWIMATNPVVSLPDADKVKAALEKCELVVVSECETNTDTTELADILLPAAAWGEKDGTVTNSERRISHQRKFLPVPGEARPDWWIITQVARKMGFEKAFQFEKPVDVFREHARLSAFENDGSRDFDLSGLADITDEAFENLAPIQWPVNETAPAGTARMFIDRKFFTPSGKARMVPIEPKLPENKTSDEYPLVLNTGRIRDQWHTMTRTGRAVRLNAHIPEPMVQIHPVDAQNWDLVGGALAKVTSKLGKMIVRVVITEEQRPGSVFVPIHWSNQSASMARVDALVSAVVDPISGQPESKHTPVNIRPYKPVWHGFILSRHPLSVKDANYWVKVRGAQFWRYEIAGEQEMQHPDVWAQKHLGTDGEWLDFIDKKAGRYRAGVIVGNRLEGVVFIAPHHDLPARSWLSQLFTSPSLTDEERYSLLVGQPGKGQKDSGAIVCSCFGVGENTLKDAISSGELDSVDAIGAKLNAGTNCGSCIPELKKLLGH